MADPHWLKRLDAQLRRHHLPAGYRARLLDELADHLSELEQETASMDAPLLLEERLGTPSELAAQARSEFDRRTFAGRHPVLTFGVAPVFGVLATVVVTLWLAFYVVWLADMTTPQQLASGVPPTALQWSVVYAVIWFVRLVPFVAMAMTFAYVGRRIHQPRCVLLASAIIAGLASIFWMQACAVSPEVQGQVRVSLALGKVVGIEHWIQAAAPLAVGLWSFARQKSQVLALSMS
ncbi:MAG: hypothetical protein U0992_08755 [Planctomycetaceae bacterium]